MRWTILAIGTLMFWACSAPAATYRVRPDGTGDFPTIQAAINAAVNGDVIELSDGTFTGAGNRDIDYLGKAITIRSQGGAENCIIDIGGGYMEPHKAFMFNSGEGPGSVLEGITMTNGTGGAMEIHTGPLIRDCVITGNHSGSYHYDGHGGGIYCSLGSPRFVNCTISGNSADPYAGPTAGGGAYLSGDGATFEYCTFLGNRANGSTSTGGNIHCTYSHASFRDCTINGGSAFQGGGIWCSDSSMLTFTRCVIADNANSGSEGSGGGIGCDQSQMTLSYCVFANNHTSGGGGGGILCEAASVGLEYCTFYGNTAYGGGGVFLGGGSVLACANTVVAFSQWANGIGCYGTSSATLICCDVFGNAWGDWVGCIADQYGTNGNISEDPCFCDAPTGDYHLWNYSPCAPVQSPDCGQIGALPVGCWEPEDAEPRDADAGPMLRCSPNPFAGGTTIAYRLQSGCPVGALFAIYDVAGRRVRVLRAPSAPGSGGPLRWDGTDDAGRALPGGIYWLQLPDGQDRTVTERVVKIR